MGVNLISIAALAVGVWAGYTLTKNLRTTGKLLQAAVDVVTATATGGAVIAGLVEVLKRTGLLDAGRFGGVLSLAFGIAYFVGGSVSGSITGTAGDPLNTFEAVVAGIVTGLTAAGAYSTLRASTSSGG